MFQGENVRSLDQEKLPAWSPHFFHHLEQHRCDFIRHQPRSHEKSQPPPEDSVTHALNPPGDSNGCGKMITRLALPASVHSGTLPVVGTSEEAKERTVACAVLLGPVVRAGMLQLDPATCGQACKGINDLGTSSCSAWTSPAWPSPLLTTHSPVPWLCHWRTYACSYGGTSRLPRVSLSSAFSDTSGNDYKLIIQKPVTASQQDLHQVSSTSSRCTSSHQNLLFSLASTGYIYSSEL